MSEALTQPLFVIVASLLVSMSGDFFLKYAMMQAGDLDISGVRGVLTALKTVFFSRNVSLFLYCGILLYCVGFLLWLVALSLAELSVAYPMESLNFVFTVFIARLVLGEKLNKHKLAGTALIVFGVAILAQGL